MRRSARFVMIGAIAVAALTTGAAPASAGSGSATGSVDAGSSALTDVSVALLYAVLKAGGSVDQSCLLGPINCNG